MSDSDFLFAVDLSDDASVDGMLTEIAAAVCAHLRVARSNCDALVAELRAERSRSAGPGSRRCRVGFTTHGGQFEVVVQYDDGREWRRAQPLS